MPREFNRETGGSHRGARNCAPLQQRNTNKSLPPHYRLVKKEKVYQEDCPGAPNTRDTPL